MNVSSALERDQSSSTHHLSRRWFTLPAQIWPLTYDSNYRPLTELNIGLKRTVLTHIVYRGVRTRKAKVTFHQLYRRAIVWSDYVYWFQLFIIQICTLVDDSTFASRKSSLRAFIRYIYISISPKMSLTSFWFSPLDIITSPQKLYNAWTFSTLFTFVMFLVKNDWSLKNSV